MFFNKMKDALQGKLKKLNGRTDFLEAVCAANALVASCDGEVSDEEIKVATKVVAANPILSGSFKQAQIEKCCDSMMKRAVAGRSGRLGLFKEIDDIAADAEMCEMVYVAALDIAEADGNVGDKEKTTLNEIAKRIGVDPKKYVNI